MAAPGSARLADVLEELLVELPAQLRGGRARLSESAVHAVRRVVEELNLVTRDDFDELELRVAQLEHRLRLAEAAQDLRPPQ
jgi:BMFP domain-containing protein YqiC